MPTSDKRSAQRLPIKLILPKQGQERKVPGGGGLRAPFREITGEYRGSLRSQVRGIESAVGVLQRTSKGPAPVRVMLIRKAVAKSHRPTRMFSDRSCPIMGAGRLGELFVKATPGGLAALGDMIERDESPIGRKELSSIETIEIVTPDFRRGRSSSADILRQSPRVDDGFQTRVRLFDFGSEDQGQAIKEFEKLCRDRKLVLDQNGYDPRSYVYGVRCRTADDVEALSKAVGVRSVGRMPRLRLLRPKATNHQQLPADLPRHPGGDAPVVVVVDSGISSTNPALNSWVIGRESKVAEEYRNEDHGTFVAGLICWGPELNPNLEDLDGLACAVFDLQVIPNSDPERGEVDELTEQELLQSLETALKQYANRYKVWNLSLGTDEVCSLDEFSPLAEQLDNLQERYKVSFVISAGNYDIAPLLDYPRTAAQKTAGRITTPADSVLGITVGSISHIAYAKKGPGLNCPSAFSRHGAGPNHIIKPDLVHYGGTCSTDLRHITGVRSVCGNESAEDLGTSFAAPLVSRALAQIYDQITPTPSPVLARALMTHHARDPRSGGRVPDEDVDFLGFGRPAPPPYCIECAPHTSTLVFEDTLRPGYFLEWDHFPYPECLHEDGRFRGEIWMTVAFMPVRGARWGSEYCETHVDAHFGVYVESTERKSGTKRVKFKGLVPPEHKNPGILYEAYQVQELRKWAPVRTYHGDLGKGERGLHWRLKLQLLTRHDTKTGEADRPQPFALIVTIADPTKKAPVYDEMARLIRTRFEVENLAIRTAARVQTRA